jgi:hypothetical protein
MHARNPWCNIVALVQLIPCCLRNARSSTVAFLGLTTGVGFARIPQAAGILANATSGKSDACLAKETRTTYPRIS